MRKDICWPKIRQPRYYILPAAILILSFFTLIKAQPGYSKSELRLIKKKGYAGNVLKFHLPQNKFPMPEIPAQNRTLIAGGGIDSSFNASITEGFGYVNETLVQPDGRIIVVGLFQRANGTRTNGIARFNADGTLDTSFNSGSGANAAILAEARQTDGKIIIGGAFTSFNGLTVNRIVRLNSDGTTDSSFNPSVSFTGQINDILVLPDGKIMVGGQQLVRLNNDGTLDFTFSDFNGRVTTIVRAPDGKILVGGFFTLPRPNIARLNADGTLDSSFNPNNGSDWVNKVALQPNGQILVAGHFFNGLTVDGLLRLNDNGSTDTGFKLTNDQNPQNLEAHGIAVQPDGKILTSYSYNDLSGQAFADVKRFNPDGTLDTTFNTGNGNSFLVTDLNLLADDRILAGGSFVSFNNEQRLRLIKLNSDGTLNNAFNPSVSTAGTVYAIKRQADGKILIGGDFEYVNDVRKSSLARLNANGTLDNSFTFNPGVTGDVYAIEFQLDGRILVGGLFSRDTNFSSNALIRLNTTGTLDQIINFSGGNRLDSVNALAVQSDGKILAGGNTNLNFQRVAATRITSTGILDGSFHPPSADLGVNDLTIQPNGKIIVGAPFITDGQTPPHFGIARLNSDGALDSGFSSNVGNVYSLTQHADSKIYAGGNTISRFTPEGALDPTLNVGSGCNNPVREVKVQSNGKILLGGLFTTYNGQPANHITRLNNDGSIDPGFNVGSGASGNVYAIELQPDGKILVGGQFLDFNGVEKFSLVRLQNSSSSAPFDFDGDGKTDISIYRPVAGEWWINRSSMQQTVAAQFGLSTDQVVPADFTGDGKADITVFRPSTGEWFILRSEDGTVMSFLFGVSGDIPVTGDFDADGTADKTVFRPSTNEWFISTSSGGTITTTFGLSGDFPVPADYDGDGKTDIAIYRPGSGQWWIQRSSNNSVITLQFGTSTDKPVQGDYTGDSIADIAVWRPSTGEWFILRSEDNSYYSVPFGTTGDQPVPGDYDGDGKFDTAVFRPTGSTWYINHTTSALLITKFGTTGDKPIPNVFVP